jgi:hypothetical protein
MTFRLIFLLCGLLLLFSACVQPCAPDPRSKKALDVETFLKNTRVREFRFEATSARDALSTLAQFTRSGRDTFRLNIVCLWPPEVDTEIPKLKINLINTTAWDTLKIISEFYDLNMRIERNVLLFELANGAVPGNSPMIFTGPRYNAAIERELDSVILGPIRFLHADLRDCISYLTTLLDESRPSDSPIEDTITFPAANTYARPSFEAVADPFSVKSPLETASETSKKVLPPIFVELDDVSILDVLHLCLHLTGLSYRISDGNIEIYAPQ